MSSPLLELALNLPERHRQCLQWFDDRQSQIVPWPGSLPDGTRLVTKAKGIYKPKWSEYALSVRQSLHGPYPDQEPETHPDGLWTYKYYQEDLDLSNFEAHYTNVGLMRCLEDVVPVGVVIQVQPKPRLAYRIQGLALVTGFGDGYFTIQGFSSHVSRSFGQSVTAGLVSTVERADFVSGLTGGRALDDERRRVHASIVQRQGQGWFRKEMLRLYGGSCSISGYEATEALEAAHIVPYRGAVTNNPTNGLLLRADLHSLFDLGLVAVNPLTRRLWLSADLMPTSYRRFSEVKIREPVKQELRPSEFALQQHWTWATGGTLK